jgi:nucleotide-binding universal stress UspA family protein
MFHRILVAIDSEQTIANQVLAEAMAIAKASSAALNIVQVISPLNTSSPTSSYMTSGGAFGSLNLGALEANIKLWQEQEQQTQARLQARVAEAQAAGIIAEATHGIGEPGREICATAEAWNADLIVLGRRGLSGLGQLLLGSVSSYVMHRAPCSVLIVQGDSPGQEAIEPSVDPSVGN